MQTQQTSKVSLDAAQLATAAPASLPRALALASILALATTGCIPNESLMQLAGKSPPSPHASGSPRAAARTVPVVAEASRKGDLPIYIDGLGTVTPFYTVTVRSRVDGQLDKVYFTEGQHVKEGDLLAQIDPRPFQVQLEQAEAQLFKDQALLKNAQVDLERYKSIPKYVSQQQTTTQDALVRQYEGAIRADQGLIANARLQLTYSRIIAPLTGRVGLRLMDPGNIVRASDVTGLLVITQQQPIAVIFSIPQDSITAVLTKSRAGDGLEVLAYDRELKKKLATGKLLALDNQVDPNTGTVKLKAMFPNTDSALFPNQFVNARLLVDVRRQVVIVPASGVQRGPDSTYTYVVKPMTAEQNAEWEAAQAAAPPREGREPRDPSKPKGPRVRQKPKVVEMRTIEIGPTEGELTEVVHGLEAGEVIVTDGADKLIAGSLVIPQAPGQESPGGHKPDTSKGPAGATLSSTPTAPTAEASAPAPSPVAARSAVPKSSPSPRPSTAPGASSARHGRGRRTQ
jgi:multidrug efflux system membrane fusion protein